MSDKLNYKPSAVFLDNKNGSYYRNMFMNNCKMGIRYCNKIKSQLNTIKQTKELIKELDLTSDPDYEPILSDIQDIELNLRELNKKIEALSEKYQYRFNELGSKDFQKLLDEHTQKIQELESKNQYERTEVNA